MDVSARPGPLRGQTFRGGRQGRGDAGRSARGVPRDSHGRFGSIGKVGPYKCYARFAQLAQCFTSYAVDFRIEASPILRRNADANWNATGTDSGRHVEESPSLSHKSVTPTEWCATGIPQYAKPRDSDLTTVGARLSQEQLTARILAGGQNMPPYGETLRPDELTALVAFLAQLR